HELEISITIAVPLLGTRSCPYANPVGVQTPTINEQICVGAILNLKLDDPFTAGRIGEPDPFVLVVQSVVLHENRQILTGGILEPQESRIVSVGRIAGITATVLATVLVATVLIAVVRWVELECLEVARVDVADNHGKVAVLIGYVDQLLQRQIAIAA